MLQMQLKKHIKLDSAFHFKRWLGKANPGLGRVAAGNPQCKVAPDAQCIFDMCALKPGIQQPCVVIIGGGLAGLSAANRLVQCGLSNFRILEAMDSPGGRLRTCWMGDTVAEVGWQNIEGASVANPLFTLAAQERLLKPPIRRVDEEAALVLTGEGRPLDTRAALRGREIFAELEAAAAEEPQEYPFHGSLYDLLKAGLNNKLKELPSHEQWDITRAFYGFAGTLRTKFGQCLKELSPEILAANNSLPGGTVRVEGGMTSLLAPLVRNLPPGALITCKPAHVVLWGGTAVPGAPRAIVRTCDGENFPADYVIVTVPLGVLKASGEKMFCPQLPAFKMEAIRGLGFGSVNKVVLKFNKPFWAEDGGEMVFAWTEKDKEDEESWIKGVSTLELIRGSKKVMAVTVGGREAFEMELLTDAQVANDLNRLLKRFLGSSVVPRPDEILRSSWSTSPYFGGYKSYLGPGAGRGTVTSIATPLPTECDDVPPIILFAGEHAHPDYLGTPHGSRLSGIREADRVISLTKKFNGPPVKPPPCIPCH